MKIGIVTQPLRNNYGGLLQNYALQYCLKKLGHDVKTINFISLHSLFWYLLSTSKQLLISILKYKRPCIKRYTRSGMAEFINKYINKTRVVFFYTKKIINEEHFDAVITGSDQVWRPRYNMFIEDMYLKFVPNNIKKIAYAASFGTDSWEYNLRYTKLCAKHSKRLNAISVREVSGIDLCKKYLEIDAQCVLDPTILAGIEAYQPLLHGKHEENYLFAYILDMSQEKIKYIKDVAQKRDLKVILQSADTDAILSVENWLTMIANASMVITDSFHGTVFSILFHRDFYSILNNSRGGTRFDSLLTPLGLECRSGDTLQLQHSRSTAIDWGKVDRILANQRKKSINFLINSLL